MRTVAALLLLLGVAAQSIQCFDDSMCTSDTFCKMVGPGASIKLCFSKSRIGEPCTVPGTVSAWNTMECLGSLTCQSGVCVQQTILATPIYVATGCEARKTCSQCAGLGGCVWNGDSIGNYYCTSRCQEPSCRYQTAQCINQGGCYAHTNCGTCATMGCRWTGSACSAFCQASENGGSMCVGRAEHCPASSDSGLMITTTNSCNYQNTCSSCTSQTGCFWNNNYCSSRCASSSCTSTPAQCPVADTCGLETSCSACNSLATSKGCVWNSPPGQPSYCSRGCKGQVCTFSTAQCAETASSCTAVRTCAECTTAGCRWNKAVDGSGFCERLCVFPQCISVRQQCQDPESLCKRSLSCGACTSQTGCVWNYNGLVGQCLDKCSSAICSTQALQCGTYSTAPATTPSTHTTTHTAANTCAASTSCLDCLSRGCVFSVYSNTCVPNAAWCPLGTVCSTNVARCPLSAQGCASRRSCHDCSADMACWWNSRNGVTWCSSQCTSDMCVRQQQACAQNTSPPYALPTPASTTSPTTPPPATTTSAPPGATTTTPPPVTATTPPITTTSVPPGATTTTTPPVTTTSAPPVTTTSAPPVTTTTTPPDATTTTTPPVTTTTTPPITTTSAPPDAATTTTPPVTTTTTPPVTATTTPTTTITNTPPIPLSLPPDLVNPQNFPLDGFSLASECRNLQTCEACSAAVKNGCLWNVVQNQSFCDGSCYLQRCVTQTAQCPFNSTLSRFTSLAVQTRTAGDGNYPVSGDMVAVHYTGYLAATGVAFDASRPSSPFQFTLGRNQVIAGWEQGIRQLSLGERARLLVPAAMAYGAQGAGSVIPPDSDLVFELQLVSINGRSSGVETVVLQLLTKGDGVNEPMVGSNLSIHYIGYLESDGTIFDSTYSTKTPFAFVAGRKQVIVGLETAVLQMSLGQRSRVLIPASLAYGSQGAGTLVKPNANLIFDILLVSVNDKAVQIAPATAGILTSGVAPTSSPPIVPVAPNSATQLACLCVEIYQPVCGSDGNTYSNACKARCALVTFTLGPCGASTNSLCITKTDCASCTAASCTFTLNNRNQFSCSSTCSSNNICWTSSQQCLQSGLGPNTVVVIAPTPPPQSVFANATTTVDCMCVQVYSPVCGSDGKTYQNGCIARCYGLQLAFAGACGSNPVAVSRPTPASVVCSGVLKCADCTAKGCFWSLAGCSSDCSQVADCSSDPATCPAQFIPDCSTRSSCLECTSMHACVWSKGKCASSCSGDMNCVNLPTSCESVQLATASCSTLTNCTTCTQAGCSWTTPVTTTSQQQDPPFCKYRCQAPNFCVYPSDTCPVQQGFAPLPTSSPPVVYSTGTGSLCFSDTNCPPGQFCPNNAGPRYCHYLRDIGESCGGASKLKCTANNWCNPDTLLCEPDRCTNIKACGDCVLSGCVFYGGQCSQVCKGSSSCFAQVSHCDRAVVCSGHSNCYDCINRGCTWSGGAGQGAKCVDTCLNGSCWSQVQQCAVVPNSVVTASCAASNSCVDCVNQGCFWSYQYRCTSSCRAGTCFRSAEKCAVSGYIPANSLYPATPTLTTSTVATTITGTIPIVQTLNTQNIQQTQPSNPLTPPVPSTTTADCGCLAQPSNPVCVKSTGATLHNPCLAYCRGFTSFVAGSCCRLHTDCGQFELCDNGACVPLYREGNDQTSAPSKPLGIRVQWSRRHSARITWKAPTKGFRPKFDVFSVLYRLKPANGSKRRWKKVMFADQQQYSSQNFVVITKLRKNSTYEVKVRAFRRSNSEESEVTPGGRATITLSTKK